MTYVLYGAHGSGSAIVELTLSEAGVPCRFERLSLRDSAQREDAYAAVNPHRKVPTLMTPAGETLTESAAIVLTLAERHPQGALLPPPGTRERAGVLRLLMFAAAELYPIIEIVDYPERFGPEAEKDAVKTQALATWRARWQTLESQLGSGPFVLGPAVCVVDFYLAVLSRWDLTAEDRRELPRVEALAEAVAARPALREVWTRNFPAQ